MLCIIDTWLSNKDLPIIASLNIPTTKFIHLPPPGPHFGGGVGVLYSNALKLIQSSDLSLDNSEAFSLTFHLPKSQPLQL